MAQPFWQRPMTSWTYDAVLEFLDERLREGEHLEYKEPTYNPQNGKWKVDPELMESLVAWANTSTGLMIVGVRDDKNDYPAEVIGIDHPDPERPLRDHAAASVEPHLRFEVAVATIPAGSPHEGRTLVVVRVRPGPTPPYLLIGRGVYVRVGSADRHATVRELEALFARRSDATEAVMAPWVLLQNRVFAPGMQDQRDEAPVVAVAVHPAFPIEPIRLTDTTDQVFTSLHLRGEIVAPETFMEPGAVTASAREDANPRTRWDYAEATADGAIGMRKSLPFATEREDLRRIDIIMLWQTVRHLMLTAEHWPRDVCSYDGPLHYRVQVGNLVDVVLSANARQGLHVLPVGSYVLPKRPNRILGWSAEGEWENGEPVDDLLEQDFASFARQLQFRHFDSAVPTIRALMTRADRE